MGRRSLNVEGPEELVDKVTKMAALIARPPKIRGLAWLTQTLERLKTMARELRASAGNSNLGEQEKNFSFSIKNLMDLGEHLSGLIEDTEAQLRSAQFGPRTLDEQVGTREELNHHLKERKGQETTAVEVGLDGLEKINTAHGRGAGDKIMVEVVEAIQKMVDSSTRVFQDGSNLVVVGSWDTPDAATQFAEDVSTATTETSHGRMLKVTIGIAYNETENVMEKAAMAREQSAEQVGVFTREMSAEKEKQKKSRALALDLLKRRDFRPEYQRIHAQKKGFFSKAPMKYEALWRSEQLSPFHFFREIKEENRIHEVTAGLLPMILKDISKKPKVQVSFNVTAEEMGETFAGQSFAAFFQTQVARYRIKPANLILELVEWGDEDRLSDESMTNLKGVMEQGCLLALDDYGVRASNLVRLMNLCENGIIPDFFKIDAALVKSFNQFLHSSETPGHEHYSVLGIRSIVNLVAELQKAYKKEIGIVAEFVSNEKLRNALEQEGVTHFQGFYLSKPAPASKAF